MQTGAISVLNSSDRMMKVSVSHVPHKPLDFALISHNVRCNRMAQNKTQAELAALADVSRSTLRRLESRSPIHLRNLEKICAALGRSVEVISAAMPYGEWTNQDAVYVRRKAALIWHTSGDRRRKKPEDNERLLQSSEERLRLARLGMVSFFEAFTVSLPYGPSGSIREVCTRLELAPNDTYAECILYCLRGDALVRVGEADFSIAEGDSIGFSMQGAASIEPARPIDANGFPPVVLFLLANRLGHVPVMFNHAKRRRIRH
jgi:transcriptional regulator with XRE-family HTH domain